MKFIIFVSIALALIVTCYAVFAVASDADERAERMYKEWKDNERSNSEDDK